MLAIFKYEILYHEHPFNKINLNFSWISRDSLKCLHRDLF